MARMRIGQVLNRMGKLTDIDIEEILTEQKVTRKPFGQIALSWGLCEPRHVWQAWLAQLGDSPDHVDLDQLGVDAQATAYMSRDVAIRFNSIPIRVLDDGLVVAAGKALDNEELVELLKLLPLRGHIFYAAADQVDRAIRAYYPLRSGAA